MTEQEHGRTPRSLDDGIKVANYLRGMGVGFLGGWFATGANLPDAAIFVIGVLMLISGTTIKIGMEREKRKYAY